MKAEYKTGKQARENFEKAMTAIFNVSKDEVPRPQPQLSLAFSAGISAPKFQISNLSLGSPKHFNPPSPMTEAESSEHRF